jgi:hypothetical protein
VPRPTAHFAQTGSEISHHDESYVCVHRDTELTIHLTLAEGETPETGALDNHCEHADRLAHEWRKAGLEVVGPEDFDSGKREASHVDPDGNLIRSGSPVQVAMPGQGPVAPRVGRSSLTDPGRCPSP